MSKRIIIYAHTPMCETDGGVVVQYYFANVLQNMFKQNVFICNKFDNNANNNIFNTFINIDSIPDEEQENTVVIYCEGLKGNPLKAKYVVRWMLSKLGQNVPFDFYYTWGPNEIIYFFLSQKDMVNNLIPVKYLTLLYINPKITNLNGVRKGTCFTRRKSFIHLNGTPDIHPNNSFEITKFHSQSDFISFFNQYEIFISYDPLTFLSIIAVMCGCVSVVVPIQDVSKQDYFKMTAFYDYMVDKNVSDIYGLAYGTSEDEIHFAKSTLHLGKKQITDIQNWFINKYINKFIQDIHNWNDNSNTLLSYKNAMLHLNEFDAAFYKTHKDLQHFSNEQLIIHYIEHGKKEGRLISHDQAKKLANEQEFDVEFYGTCTLDLHHFSPKQLVEHYLEHGKNEGRLINKKQFYELHRDFDITFYKNNHADLKNQNWNDYQIILHYIEYGKKEGRLTCLPVDFNWETYLQLNPKLVTAGLNTKELAIYHYVTWGKKEGRKYLSIDLYLNQANLINKNVCFLHFCNKDNNFDILNDQLNYIKSTGLYEKLDYIFIIMLGKYYEIPYDCKIKLVYYSSNIYEWEFPSIQHIKYFADIIQDNIRILYIHTKGVLKNFGAHEYRKYLEYFLIEKHALCLDALRNYKCVGVTQQFYFDDNKYRNHFSGNFWWTNSSYIKTLQNLEVNEDRYVTEHWLIGNFHVNDYRNFCSLHHTHVDMYKIIVPPKEYNLEIIKNIINNNLVISYKKNRNIYGVYFIYCVNNYLNIIRSQLKELIDSGLYSITDKIICFVCNQTAECLELLQQYDKIQIVSTSENLYEKFAINNYKKYLNGDYYMYYIHSKSVTRQEACFADWTTLCNYFTINKWRLSIELLKYYDCVGVNLKNFPKKHYSGNFWWSKSEHLNKLRNINDGYLSAEMYIMSYMKTNYVSIHQSNTNHGNTVYPEFIYKNIPENELINNICIIPYFNSCDKMSIKYCGEVDLNHEPPIL